MKKEDVKYKRHSDYEDGGDKAGQPTDYLHFKLIVKTEEEKQEFLKASEYIHYLSFSGYKTRFGKKGYESCDSDIMAVNWFMHLYVSPDAIEVRPDESFYGFINDEKN
jgi:hypothetical protein